MASLEEILQACMAAPPERRVAALRLLQGATPIQEPFLTLRGLSRQIGFGVTSLRRWNVPFHDLGGIRRYKLSEVENYLASAELLRRQAALRAERRTERSKAKAGGSV